MKAIQFYDIISSRWAWHHLVYVLENNTGSNMNYPSSKLNLSFSSIWFNSSVWFNQVIQIELWCVSLNWFSSEFQFDKNMPFHQIFKLIQSHLIKFNMQNGFDNSMIWFEEAIQSNYLWTNLCPRGYTKQYDTEKILIFRKCSHKL